MAYESTARTHVEDAGAGNSATRVREEAQKPEKHMSAACICMHMHAYACMHACICIHACI